MRIEMKRLLLIFTLYVCCVPLFSQESENPLVKQIQHIKQQQGDSIARCYLDSKKDSLEQKGENGSYLLLWGLLTSNMWQNNPTESLKTEYREYLNAVIDDEIKSKEYMPSYELLSSLWQLTYDYYNMLYREGDKENTLLLLSNIHRWFEPYAEAKNSLGYARSLLDLCLILVRDLHKYKEGESFCREYVDVAKNVYGEKSAQYAVALYNLTVLPQSKSDEKKILLEKAIAIYEEAGVPDAAMLQQMKQGYNMLVSRDTGVANSIEIKEGKMPTLEECYNLVISGEGNNALKYLIQYKEQMQNEQYIDTLKLASTIILMINAYMESGDLASAQNEIESFNNKYGIDVNKLPAEYVQIFFSSAGIVALRLKNYPLALRYCHAACNLHERTGDYGIEYVKVLSNIATIYAEAGQNVGSQFYLDAKWYIDEAVSVFEERIGPLSEHGITGIQLLNSKALVYSEIGDREDAIEIFENIVQNYSNNDDVRSVWVLAANNLAILYMKSGNSKAAVNLLESLSSDNALYRELFKKNLALAYYATGDEKLRKTIGDSNEICYNNCMDVFSFFTVAERENFWTRISLELLLFNNLVAEKYPTMTDIAFDNLLFVKNLKLMSSDILKGMVDNSSDPELKRKYNRILALRNDLSYRSNEQDSVKIWKKELDIEERNILKMIPDYKNKLLGVFHKWGEIKNVLRDDEIAIDFTYVPQMEDWDNAKGFYGAFVITNKSQMPELVRLCGVDDLESYFFLKEMDAMQISSLYKDSVAIYEKLWGKLEEHIKGKQTIYFSPTGPLNLLNHEALKMPDGNIFGDKYNLVRLSSTDRILANASKGAGDKPYQSAVVYGGILYDLSVSDMTEAAKTYKHSAIENNLLAMRSEDERGKWNYLQGTKTESQNVYDLLSSNKISSLLLQDASANEESFKALNGQAPSIIHLSTHGFFLDTTDKVKKNPFMNKIGGYSEKEDKLIRTGLLMAGANNVWCGKAQVTGIEDGILTADEISRMDLSQTKLVVLSACETAKGSVDPIDGVLGLQSGFKKAGAQTILMSLWRVSDAVTSILMTEFYANLGKGLSVYDSLKFATRKVKEQYPEPYYWASFVLLD